MQDDGRVSQALRCRHTTTHGDATSSPADEAAAVTGVERSINAQQAFNKRSVLQVPRRQACAGLAVIADGR
ncbi:MAG: hypothetical protein QOD67_1863 [Caballeronia sp.]|nr:hypothetical protein [Caballeronia sp.]